MEFVFGSLVSAVILLLGYFIFNKTNIKYKPFKIKASQSRTHSLLYPITLPMPHPHKKTQSLIHLERSQVKVLFTEKYAYWISNNSVYRANLSENGLIIQESSQVLDMMGMDKVQLDEMIFIVEKLTEGKNNDYWSSGNS